MGPEPFRFTPGNGSAIEGAAFSPFFKLLATLIVGACGAWFYALWNAGALGSARTTGTGWLMAGLAIMVWTWWAIITSRTRIDAKGLHQRWMWNKEMPLDDLAYGKLIRVRGLEWLIAPRLYVRTLLGKFAVFYGATPELIADFERLAAELKAQRGL